MKQIIVTVDDDTDITGALSEVSREIEQGHTWGQLGESGVWSLENIPGGD